MCWLCGQVVDKQLPWPDPMSASVDHVVPVSMGGPMTDPSNLRLAHLRCNSSRGNGSRGKGTRAALPLSRSW